MKRITATQVNGVWVVVVESPSGDPITRREINLFQRALTLKLRVYYVEQRRLSLVRVAAEEARQAAEAKVIPTSVQTTTIDKVKG